MSSVNKLVLNLNVNVISLLRLLDLWTFLCYFENLNFKHCSYYRVDTAVIKLNARRKCRTAFEI